MVCNIHLRLERKRKEPKVINEYYTQGTEWIGCNVTGYNETWSDRIYGMFAVLADVRNYNDVEHLPLRGFPSDACDSTKRCYTFQVLDDEEYQDQEWAAPRSDAERWIKEGYSQWMEVYKSKHITGPDWHSPNWCTTKEMEECINKVFKNEDGTYKGDYEEWVALLSAMKGYESTGEYECRAVFWFDN